MSGMTLSWSWSNFQRPDSAPNVTSNFPPVHSLICRAALSTSRTPVLTCTGVTPAARFTRWMSLSGIQVLISVSSRAEFRKHFVECRLGAWLVAGPCGQPEG